MIKIATRNKIVSSYSSVLEDLLFNDVDCISNLNRIQEIFNSICSLNTLISPNKISEYNIAISNIKKSLNKSNKIEVFLNRLLERRYLFLLNDIINETRIRINKKKLLKNVIVLSCEDLSDNMKNEIKDIIVRQVNDNGINVEFKVDENIKKNTIDFISNGKICSVDLRKISNIYF